MRLAVVAEAPAPRRLLESVSECGVESVEVGWKHDGVGGKRRGNGELTFLPVNVAEVTAGIDDISYSALELFCFWVQRLVYTLHNWKGSACGNGLGLDLRAIFAETRRAHTWETTFRFPIP